MAVRGDRSDVKQTTTGFRGPLMVQSLTSAKSKFLSLAWNSQQAKKRSGVFRKSFIPISDTYLLNVRETSYTEATHGKRVYVVRKSGRDSPQRDHFPALLAGCLAYRRCSGNDKNEYLLRSNG